MLDVRAEKSPRTRGTKLSPFGRANVKEERSAFLGGGAAGQLNAWFFVVGKAWMQVVCTQSSQSRAHGVLRFSKKGVPCKQ